MLFAVVATKFVFSGNILYIVLSLSILSVLMFVLLFLKKIVPLCVLMAFCALGVGMYFVGISSFSSKEYDGVCHISGRFTDYVSGSQRILDEVKINGESAKNIYVSVIYSSQEIEIGDYVEFDAVLKNAHLFSLGDLNEFHFRNNIAYTTSVNESDLITTGRKVKFAENFRLSVKNVLENSMGKENAALAYAVLFGDKTEVDGAVKRIYNEAGLIHLLTVSGLHISFLIAALGFLLKKCRVKSWLNFLINLSILLVYAYLCGFSPSVVRAGIMGMVFLFATTCGKWYDNLNSLGFAGILILLTSPLSAFDVGFLMSFSSVLGIFLLYPILNKWIGKVIPKGVSKYIAITLSAQIGILPFAAKIFSSINLLSFFVNLLIVPLFGIIFPLLFVGSLLSLLTSFFGFIPKLCGYGFDLIYIIAQKFSQTNLKVDLKPTTIYVVLAFFLLLFLFGRFIILKKKAMVVSRVAAVCLFALCFGLSFVPKMQTSMVAVFNNYANYSILVTNSHKESVIIDLGYNQDMQNFKTACGANSVGAVFILNEYNLDYSAYQNVCSGDIIVCGDGFGYAEEVCVLENQPNKLGKFDYSYVSVGGKVIGLEMEFDKTKLFVFSSFGLTEDDVRFVSERDYDIVIYEGVAEFSSVISKKTTVIAEYDAENVTTNSNEDGNIAYFIDGKNYYWRCLD